MRGALTAWLVVLMLGGCHQGRGVAPGPTSLTAVAPQGGAYWTYYARRLADEKASGRRGYDGYGSFQEATGGLVRLHTEIEPRGATAIPRAPQSDSPPLDRRGWGGIALDDDVPSRVAIGTPLTISGTLVGGRPGDRIRLYLYRCCTDGEIDVQEVAVEAGGRFTIAMRPGRKHRGALRAWFYSIAAGGAGTWHGPGWGVLTVE